MKISSVIAFTILIGLTCLTQTILSHKCLKFKSPIDQRTEIIDCPTADSSTKHKRQAPTSDSNNMFTINFNCSSTDTVLCGKVNDTFNAAGLYLTATLNLKQNIIVSAQFLDLCQELGCSLTSTVLGAATPSMFLPYQDPADNNTLRLYPPALLKQLNVAQAPGSPGFGPDDIQAMFNSKVDYWFEGDPPIQPQQIDLLYIITHELTHGLGFVSSWNDWMQISALTPALTLSNSNQGQFVEFIFDKFMVFMQNGTKLTTVTNQMNQFKFNGAMPDSQIITSFEASPQFKIAKTLFQDASTPKSFGFLVNPNPSSIPLTQNDAVILETTIPFTVGSSISHVDFNTYQKTSDFLMMFQYPHATLDQMMSNAGSTNTTGPVGPKLRQILGAMGYDVKTTYTPPTIVIGSGGSGGSGGTGGTGGTGTSGNATDPPAGATNPFSTSQSNSPNNGPPKTNSSSSSSHIGYNSTILSLICILLSFIYNIY